MSRGLNVGIRAVVNIDHRQDLCETSMTGKNSFPIVHELSKPVSSYLSTNFSRCNICPYSDAYCNR